MDRTLSSKAFVYPSPRSSRFIARHGERNLYLDSDVSSLSFTFHIHHIEIMMLILIELITMGKGNNICKAQCLGHNKCSVSIFPFLLPSLHDSFSFFLSH